MKVFDAIRSRRSIRKFKDDEIPRAVIGKIVETMRWAPTAGNTPHLYAIVVENPGLRKEISAACVDQDWMYGAPTIIVICSKTSDLKKDFGKRSEVYSVQGSAAATQNILLAAEELGVSSTWVGAFSESRIKKALKIPQSINIHNLVALGYPKRVPKAPARPPTYKIVKFGSWSSRVKGQKDFPYFWEPDAGLLNRRLSKTVDKIKKKVTRKSKK